MTEFDSHTSTYIERVIRDLRGQLFKAHIFYFYRSKNGGFGKPRYHGT